MAGWFNPQQLRRPIKRADNPALPWQPIAPNDVSMAGGFSPLLPPSMSGGVSVGPAAAQMKTFGAGFPMQKGWSAQTSQGGGGGGGGMGGGGRTGATYEKDDGKRIDAHVYGDTVARVNRGAAPYRGLPPEGPILPVRSAHEQLLNEAANFQPVMQDALMAAKGAPPQRIDPLTGLPLAERGGDFSSGALIVGDSSDGRPNPELVITSGPSRVVPVDQLPLLPPNLLPAVNRHREEPNRVAYDAAGNVVGFSSGLPHTTEDFEPVLPMKYARPQPLGFDTALESRATPGNPEGIIAGVTPRANLRPSWTPTAEDIEGMRPPSREDRAIRNLLRSGDPRSVGTALHYRTQQQALQADEERRRAATQVQWLDTPDGGKIAMTGSGGVAYVQRPEQTVAPEDILELPTKDGGTILVNRRTSQVLDKSERPFTEEDLLTVPSASGARVTMNRRTGATVDRAPAPKQPFTAEDFETFELQGGGSVLINKRTGQPVTVQKPAIARDGRPIIRNFVPPGSPLGTAEAPHLLDLQTNSWVPMSVAAPGAGGGSAAPAKTETAADVLKRLRGQK